jgi:hypothetical protein
MTRVRGTTEATRQALTGHDDQAAAAAQAAATWAEGPVHEGRIAPAWRMPGLPN